VQEVPRLAEAPTDPARRRRAAGLLVVGVLVACGAWLRLASLDRLSFWADEFPHAVAAKNLIEHGTPELPSGKQYRRALAQTVAVSLSMRVFGENEAAARLPSALVGVATIALVWLVVRRRFGEIAGVAAAAVLAVLPLHVAHSRSARFYVAFALAYGATVVVGTRALEDGSVRMALVAVAAFAIALHLQPVAVLVVPAFAVQCVIAWRRTEGSERRRLARVLGRSATFVAIAAGVALAVPGLRAGALRMFEHPVPGLDLAPGFGLRTLGELFGLVSWWAWIPLAPAAVAGLRRAGRRGAALAVHLLVPALAVAILYRPASAGARVDARYLLHLVPLLAAVVGVAIAELVRLLGLIRSRPGALALCASALAGALVASGVTTVWSLPGEAHPGRVIGRADWKAAAATIRARWKPGDALLSSAPLATAWELGRCGDWLRGRSAAAPFIDEGADVFCGSRLVGDAASLGGYFVAHPRGWIVADAARWTDQLDPSVRAMIQRETIPVAVDRTVLIFRWG
jgi:hypothetical protein